MLVNNSTFLSLHSYPVPGRGRSPHTMWNPHCNQQTCRNTQVEKMRPREVHRLIQSHRTQVGSTSSVTHYVHGAAQLQW